MTVNSKIKIGFFASALLLILSVLFLAGCDDEAADSRPGTGQGLSLPFIVVDLDGDGIEMIPLEGSSVYFDVDGDGLAERTAWVHPDDGILMIYERLLDSGSTKVLDKGKRLQIMATRGVSKLNTFDTNGDGVVKEGPIEIGDSVPAGFWVWEDNNQNGFAEKDEQLNWRSKFFVDAIHLPDFESKKSGKVALSDRRIFDYDEIRFKFSDENLEWKIPPKQKE